MAASTLFTCLCGVQKKSTNHWVLARVTPTGITFLPWDWRLAVSDDVTVLCGEGCAVALLSRHLGDWKLAALAPAATAPEPAAPGTELAAPAPEVVAQARQLAAA